MPKLPDNFVKAPQFDNPLRSTASDIAAEQKLLVRFDETTWKALRQACLRDGSTPEAVVQRALAQFLAEPVRVAMAPVDADVPRPNPMRAQLIDELRAQLGRRSWVQCFLTLRAIVREVRA